MGGIEASSGGNPLVVGRYDPAKHGHISTVIANVVAEAADSAPTELSPLAEHLDDDAIDALLDRSRRPAPPTDLLVAFDYEGFRVHVEGDGTVGVHDRTVYITE